MASEGVCHNVVMNWPWAQPKPKELSEEDFRLVLDGRVRRTLDMSLEDFTAALKDGRLDPESPKVAGLAVLVDSRTR